MIHSVKAGSPMEGLLHPEDIVIYLDDEVRLVMSILIAFSLCFYGKLTTICNRRTSPVTMLDNLQC